MQSASVIIEIATTAGQRQTQSSDNASTAGGLFGNELKQQQQQIEAQHARNSQASSDSDKSVVSRDSESPDTPSNSDRDEGGAQQAAEQKVDGAGSESRSTAGNSTDGASSDEMVPVEQSSAVAGDEGDESVEDVVIAIQKQPSQIENPLPVNNLELADSESTKAAVSEGDNEVLLEQSVESGTSGTGPVDPDGHVVAESGNNLPLNMQNGGATGGESLAALQPVHEDGDDTTMESGVPTGEVGDTSIMDEEMVSTNSSSSNAEKQFSANGPKLEVVLTGEDSEGSKRASSEIDAEASNRAAAITASETASGQAVVDKHVTGETAPQAVVPLAANGSPTSQSSHNDPVALNSAISAVSNASSNQSAGMGAGNSNNPNNSNNSNNSNFMAGHQQPANIDVTQSEGDLKQPSDKTAAFLESLKSAAKDGGKVVDMPVASQAGTKPQTQPLSQVISQLSSIQSGTQTQAATASTAPPPIASAGSTPALMTIATSMRQQGWDRAMGERMVFMARNGIQEAQIQVNPRHMGPIDIKVSVNQEQQTHVSFVTTNSAARETIDAAMPRLREMFDQAGLNLAESEVSQRDQQQSGKGEAADDEGTSNELAANGLEDDQDEIMARQVGYVRPSGLDLFA